MSRTFSRSGMSAKSRAPAVAAVGLAVMMVSVLCTSALVPGCSRKDAGGPAGSLVIAGSTALQPLVDQAAKQFMANNTRVQITVNGGGSGAGLTQVAEGSIDIGDSDIAAEEMPGVDASKLVDHKVAVVGFAVVANPRVGVDNLTQRQLIDIFTGRLTNWKELGGADQRIVVINRGKGSGTRAAFKQWALRGNEEIESMNVDSSGEVRQTVAATPGAISYLAFSYLDDSVKVLNLDGVAPTVENVTSGRYPVWSYEHMYTKGDPGPLAKAFLDYILSDAVQKSLVTRLGYIPVADMQVTR